MTLSASTKAPALVTTGAAPWLLTVASPRQQQKRHLTGGIDHSRKHLAHSTQANSATRKILSKTSQKGRSISGCRCHGPQVAEPSLASVPCLSVKRQVFETASPATVSIASTKAASLREPGCAHAPFVQIHELPPDSPSFRPHPHNTYAASRARDAMHDLSISTYRMTVHSRSLRLQ